ncbi:MAG: cation transporter [Myxococcales bacterium]|nr:cation transporter [Myxococcales bacterium]
MHGISGVAPGRAKPTDRRRVYEHMLNSSVQRQPRLASSARESNRAKKLTLGGAVLAALAASSCCIGPLLLAAFGIGGAGALATLGAYRPYILAVTAVLLAAGFYLTYRKPRATTAGDACGCEAPHPQAGRAGRIGLWIATVMVVVFATAPYLIARVAARGHEATAVTTPGATIDHITIRVEGMDCEACSVNIRRALEKVGGLHDMTLDLKAQTIDVAYEPAAGRVQAYVAAINDLAYEASLPGQAPSAIR